MSWLTGTNAGTLGGALGQSLVRDDNPKGSRLATRLQHRRVYACVEAMRDDRMDESGVRRAFRRRGVCAFGATLTMCGAPRFLVAQSLQRLGMGREDE